MCKRFENRLIEFLPNLRRFAISISRSPCVADDLVQITCEKALRNQHTFEPGSNIDALLFRILRNVWIDHTRRKKTEGISVDIDHDLAIPAMTHGSDAENRLVLQDIIKAINGLPRDQREVMMMICMGERSYKDTSHALDVPIGTVMSRLARAREKLLQMPGIMPHTPRSPSQALGEHKRRPTASLAHDICSTAA